MLDQVLQDYSADAYSVPYIFKSSDIEKPGHMVNI